MTRIADALFAGSNFTRLIAELVNIPRADEHLGLLESYLFVGSPHCLGVALPPNTRIASKLHK
jgi:hypothetical protein